MVEPVLLFFLVIMAIFGWMLFIIALNEKNYAEGFIMVFVDQERVNMVLKKWAFHLNLTCKNQIELQKSAYTNTNVEIFEQGLQTSAQSVNVAKEEFWSKWQLAKNMRFNVRESYKDYVSVPIADDESKGVTVT